MKIKSAKDKYNQIIENILKILNIQKKEFKIQFKFKNQNFIIHYLN